MGMWDVQPYDNDGAADLLSDFMSETKFRETWYAQISDEDIWDEPEELRALVWLFLQLGRVYVWPIEHYDQDLELATKAANALLHDEDLAGVEGLVGLLQSEYDELVSRKK